jgi:hypothetical protein
VSYATTTPTFAGYGYGQVTSESTTTLPSWVAIVVVGGVVLGIGYLIFKGVDARQRRLDRIAEKEGSSGVLKYEAGEALLGLGTAAGYSLLDRPRRNPRRRRRSRRRS